MGNEWTPVSVVVPPDQRSRCGKFGYDLVQHIKATRMDGRKIKPDWLHAEFQAMSKLCEVIGAMACGLEPDDLDWDYTREDPGWDFLLDDLKVDVKGTWVPDAHYLIYPWDKAGEFERHDTDALLMVWAVDHRRKNFGYGEARGYVTKRNFGLNRYVWTKQDWNERRKFKPGTWVMHERHLMPMGELVGGKWRNEAHARREIFGGLEAAAEARHAGRRDGKVEGGLSK